MSRQVDRTLCDVLNFKSHKSIFNTSILQTKEPKFLALFRVYLSTSMMLSSFSHKRKSRKNELSQKKKFRGKFCSFYKCNERSGEIQVGWNRLPSELLIKIFQFLSHRELSKASQVCQRWNSIGRDPELWQRIEIVIGKSKNATANDYIQFVLENHSQNLKSVIFKIDSAVESAEKACQILQKFVDCSIRTLALISSTHPVFFDVDQEFFTSSLTVVFHKLESLRSLAIDNTPVDDPTLRALATNHSKTLQLLRIKSCPFISPEGVLALADNCHRLKELSISYTLLSDDLLLCLSSEEHVRLTDLSVDIYSEPDSPPFGHISTSSWRALIKHSPNINLLLYFFTAEEQTYDPFFTSYSPVTHLYFCQQVPKHVLRRVSQTCPLLRELVISGTDSACIDSELMDIAKHCRLLSSIGLSDCIMTCTGFIEFVGLCKKRLSELYVNEDCLIQDSNCDLQTVIDCVSRLLSKDWAPQFTPLW